MLKNYLPIINNVTLYPSDKWSEDSAVVEETYQTEAGTDQASVTRYDKLTVSAQYRCNSEWYGTFKKWSKTDQLSVSLYDPIAKGYSNRTMRMRNFKADLIENTEGYKDSDGIWDISFDLEEF